MATGERRLQAVLGLKGGRTKGVVQTGMPGSLELVSDMFKRYF